jgi:quercetin dioxygenase-like cupin family protein
MVMTKVGAQQTDSVSYFKFSTLPLKKLSAVLDRRMISGKEATIGYFVYKKGAIVPLHHHDNEQYSIITAGSVKVTIADKIYIVKSGEGIIIPAGVPHKFEALEDNTIDIDFFSPKREDWINGTETYFTNKE